MSKPTEKQISVASVLLSLVMLLIQWGVLARITEIATNQTSLNTRLSRIEGKLGGQLWGVGP